MNNFQEIAQKLFLLGEKINNNVALEEKAAEYEYDFKVESGDNYVYTLIDIFEELKFYACGVTYVKVTINENNVDIKIGVYNRRAGVVLREIEAIDAMVRDQKFVGKINFL